MMAILLARVIFITVCVLAGAAVAPSLGLGTVPGVLLGAAGGLFAVALELAAGGAALQPLVWGALGAGAGLFGGLALGTALAPLAGGAEATLRGVVAMLAAWVGGAVAARRAAELPRVAWPAAAPTERILDTSVIVDGRIAEIAETGFLDGSLVVPQFVVRELQGLADSGDAVRRNRGRRGFDVLDRLRRSPAVRLTLLEAEVPEASVDTRLVALARARGARLLTNDAGLGRVAALAGVAVSSINELALALKPAALPGETMQVQVVREGKEAGQGVGYLDDGTMVVVEGGKRFLGQLLDVVVTSALQTAAGRMIFSRPRDEGPRDA